MNNRLLFINAYITFILIGGILSLNASPVGAENQGVGFTDTQKNVGFTDTQKNQEPAGIAENTPPAVTRTSTTKPNKVASSMMPIDKNQAASASPSNKPIPPNTTNTRIEIQNQAPVANPPVNVNIQVPENPSPENTAASKETIKETLIERTTVVNEVKPEEPENNNVMYLAVFGILALAVIFGMLIMRRKSGEKSPK
jgi:hypothetical protein